MLISSFSGAGSRERYPPRRRKVPLPAPCSRNKPGESPAKRCRKPSAWRSQATWTPSSPVRCGRITERALRDWWGIAAPRLAVCALNPHAGESGLFGDEDDRVLAPAARTLGAAGPLPADTVFVRALKGEFDAVLTPYHDVGMTAVKVSGFGKGVNVTLGLPFPRVAPDHGTALDIAGRGTADSRSMRAALDLAVELTGRQKSAS